jgi:hypothetical protein
MPVTVLVAAAALMPCVSCSVQCILLASLLLLSSCIVIMLPFACCWLSGVLYVHLIIRYQPKGSPNRVKVAVKRLKKELYDSSDDTKLFAQEVQLMRKLRHRCAAALAGCVCTYVSACHDLLEAGG